MKYIYTFLIIIGLSGSAFANEIYSCKQVAEAHVGSESTYGRALYGDSSMDQKMLSSRESKILIIQQEKKVTFGGEDYSYLGYSSGYFYTNSYLGTLEVYDRSNNKVTLFLTRSNGSGSQKSNRLDIENWHCNK